MGITTSKLFIIVVIIAIAISILAGYYGYKLVKSFMEVGKPLICPADKDTIGLLCYDKCPAGYKNDGTGICYKDCPAGWEGTSSLTHCQKNRVYSSAGPISESTLICPAGKENRAGLCYDKCPDGYTSDGANICYRDCPAGWEGTSSLTHCQKKRDYSPGKVPNTCPDGYELWGGLCYKKCPAGSNRTASCTCDFGAYGGVITDCYDQNIRNAEYGTEIPAYPGWRRTAVCTRQYGGIITDCGKYGVSQLPGCGISQEKWGALCYEKCPAGKQRLGSDIEYCGSICPAGYIDIGIGGCQKPTTTVSTGQALTAVGICPAGKEKYGLLCYPKCPEGKQRQSSDLEFCGTICPAGYIDIGIGGCQKPTQRTKSYALTEVGVCPKGSVKKGLLCYSS